MTKQKPQFIYINDCVIYYLHGGPAPVGDSKYVKWRSIGESYVVQLWARECQILFLCHLHTQSTDT